MATRMLQRRGTTAEWEASDVVLGDGEIGFDTDTKQMKIGDGVSTWTELPYLYELLAHAVATYETAAHALATYETISDANAAHGILAADINTRETIAHAAATYETAAHAVATYATIADAETKVHAAATYATIADAETQVHATATFETLVHAAATYETQAHATSTYETKAHATATYATIADAVSKSAAAQQVVSGAGGLKAINGLWDGPNRVYSAGNPPPSGGGAVINQIIRGTFTQVNTNASAVTTVTIPSIDKAKAQLNIQTIVLTDRITNTGSVRGYAFPVKIATNTTMTLTNAGFAGVEINGPVAYEITEWT